MDKEDELKKSLATAMQRVDMQFNDIDLTVKDLYEEFSFLTLKGIREAIRNGSMSKYGRSYKLSTQEVCFWVREYIKENNKNRCI